jgi:ApaG protein
MLARITSGLRVVVEMGYQDKISDPTNHRFVFAYRITLENHNDFPVQLISRHWYIFDSIGEKNEVVGDGVVGHQPVIYPEGTYQYISGSNLRSDYGAMHGYYIFENTITGDTFQVEIPKFVLTTIARMN